MLEDPDEDLNKIDRLHALLDTGCNKGQRTVTLLFFLNMKIFFKTPAKFVYPSHYKKI